MTMLARIDGFMNRLFQPPEQRIHPAQVTEAWLKSLGLGVGTSAGADITEDNVLTIMPVLACVKVLAESVAQLPLVLYRDLGGKDGRERAKDQRLFSLLHDKPNPEMTSFYWRETMMGHLALRGNAYSEIEYNNAGEVIGIWPLRPDMTAPRRIDSQLKYEVRLPSGPTVLLPRERVLHIPGFGFDGIVGYSPVTLAREAIGLTKATEEYGARYFGNGAKPGGVLQHPGKLSPTASANLRDSWDEAHQGLSQAHRMAILEEGMTYHQIGLAPEDSQFLETRTFQLRDVARMFRISSHMINDLERATFSSVEQLSLEFVIYTLMPWLTRWEQQIKSDLLRRPGDANLYARFNVAGLLRGDNTSRWEAYTKALQQGVYSINDVLKLEDMNPVDGGDVHLVPLNMIPLGQIGQGMSVEAAPTEEQLTRCDCGQEHRDGQGMDSRVRGNDGGHAAIQNRVLPEASAITPGETRAAAKRIVTGRQRMARAYRRVFEDVIGRVIRRECADVRRSLHSHMGKRDAKQFAIWLNEFYREHREFWKRNIMPILLTYADQVGVNVAEEIGGEPKSSKDIQAFIEKYADNLAVGETLASFNQLRALIEQAIEANEDPTEAVEARLDEWQEKRPGRLAEDESRGSLYGFVTAFYVASQVVRMMWVTAGDSCPYCLNLDGRVVNIDEIFVGKDVDFQPEGAERPLTRGSDTAHPPLHNGCDCGLVAR